nr:immunoglobulin heavy chain junction region [Mus musculus]
CTRAHYYGYYYAMDYW